MKNIFDLNYAELETYLLSIQEKKYRAKQIFTWLYKKKAKTFAEMTDLSKDLIAKLEADFKIAYLEIVAKQVSVDSTTKYVLLLDDKNTIEAVIMNYDWGKSICISSQVGCNMACSFCASGLNKCLRNLSSGEFIRQILTIEECEEKRITNVVIMGIGEPFNNYDNTIKAIFMMIDPKCLEIGQRKITVSTSGIVNKIYDFANENTQVNLAISLHASNDEIRSKIMPINRKYPLDELINACRYYIDKTNRRITFEYILLDHVNDSEANANELSNLIRGLNAYVNLISYNEVKEFDYKKSSFVRRDNFYKTLQRRGINVQYRKEKGADIFAACGQLRRKVSL